MKGRFFGLIGLTLSFGALVAIIQPAYAEDPADGPVTRIFISDSLLLQKIDVDVLLRQGIDNVAKALSPFTAFADGEKCATVSLADEKNQGSRPASVILPPAWAGREAPGVSTGKVLVIGAKGQPSACRREGARLTLVDGRGDKLAQEFLVKPGYTYELITLGPEAAGLGPDVTPAALNPLAPSLGGADWLRRGAVGAGIGALAGLAFAYAYMLWRKSARLRT